MKKYQLIQVFKPFEGKENILQDCFIRHLMPFDNLKEAKEYREKTKRPGWFLIIKVW